MDLTKKEFIEMLGCSNSTFHTYIGRPEFSNIKKVRLHRGNKTHYTNITEENINRFKYLLTRKKGYYYV